MPKVNRVLEEAAILFESGAHFLNYEHEAQSVTGKVCSPTDKHAESLSPKGAIERAAFYLFPTEPELAISAFARFKSVHASGVAPHRWRRPDAATALRKAMTAKVAVVETIRLDPPKCLAPNLRASSDRHKPLPAYSDELLARCAVTEAAPEFAVMADNKLKYNKPRLANVAHECEHNVTEGGLSNCIICDAPPPIYSFEAGAVNHYPGSAMMAQQIIDDYKAASPLYKLMQENANLLERGLLMDGKVQFPVVKFAGFDAGTKEAKYALLYGARPTTIDMPGTEAPPHND